MRRHRRWAVAALVAVATAGAALLPTASASATNGYHSYSVAMQSSGSLTGARASWHDFEPGLTRPLLNLDGCYNDADVNAAVWLLLSNGAQIEIGYTVDSCGPTGHLLAYRYVAVTDQALDQQIIELDRQGIPTDSLLDHFLPNNAGHTYTIQRAADPHVWLFELDGRVVHRWRSSTVLTARTAETGVESYAPFARVRVRFGHLAVQRGAGWTAWQTDHVATTGRMSGSNGTATWNAREN